MAVKTTPADQLRRLREKTGMLKNDMGKLVQKRLGICVRSYVNYESGRTVPHPVKLAALVEFMRGLG